MIQFDTQHYTSAVNSVIKKKKNEIITTEINKHIDGMKNTIIKEIIEMLPKIETLVYRSMEDYGSKDSMNIIIKLEEK